MRKLEILADAAKYDASCASSGAKPRDSRDGKGIGSATRVGICHSYAPDGRCISLLKILLTNVCIYDCHFCINRRSSSVERARMSVNEVVRLTLDFYKRNYIEGLFLSSGIIRSADYTMEQVVAVARKLREEHGFRGYIHLKTIPEASAELIAQAGRYADRISINVELPSEASLRRLAPEKNLQRTQQAMAGIRQRIEAATEEKQAAAQRAHAAQPPPFATGQSTQLIVGADESSDHDILQRSSLLYTNYRLRRVYFSAFSPIPSTSTLLPAQSPPLVREHRLYQADWLMRFYGYRADELTEAQGHQANLDLGVDPKLAWALRNRHLFPLDLNRASRELLLRVPGLGVRNVNRLLMLRRLSAIRLADLLKLRVSLKKCLPFIITADHHPGRAGLDQRDLRRELAPRPQQTELALFEARVTATTGEL